MRRKEVITVCTAAAWTGFGFFAWAAWQCVQTARQAVELWPYLISEAEPFAQSAMYTLEDRQFRWYLAGGLSGVCSWVFLAVGLGLSRWRRKGGPNEDTTSYPK